MFLIAFLTTLREGIEAGLIVGIVAGFLHQSGHGRLIPYVWLGTLLAALLCLALGIGFHLQIGQIPQKQQELVVGVLGLVAVAMLTTMIFWLKNTGARLAGDIRASVANALHRGNGQGWGLVLMAFLAVAREGLETIFFLIAVFVQHSQHSLAMQSGGLSGLLAAALIAYLIYRGSVKINLKRFFNITAVLLIFIAAGLFIGAFRALHEAGIFNLWQVNPLDWSSHQPLNWSHFIHPDSPLGVLLGGFCGYTDAPVLADFLLYLLYLLPTLFLFFRLDRQPKAAG